MRMKIPALDLVHEFQTMHAEDWQYTWGASSDGNVDCSGAFVHVYRKHGLSIYHGSNRIARVHVEKLIPMDEAISKGLVVPGMAAFKRRRPGEGKYDLPGQYREDGDLYNGDLNDYYHIGLVDEDIVHVLNAQGTKNDFERDRITDNWSHVARLLDVDYGETPAAEEQPPTVAPSELLRKGSTGNAVRELQRLLRSAGYLLQIDGKFGELTRQAVLSFQGSNGLKRDGIAGPLTMAALNKPQPLYTVTITGLQRAPAQEIADKYGGMLTAESGDAVG